MTDNRAHRLRWDLRSCLPWVFLAAFAARAAFVLIQLRWAPFSMDFEAGDSWLYRSLSVSLRQGTYALAGEPTAYVPPGYPLALALLSILGVDGTLGVGLAQSLIAAVGVLALADVARRVGGSSAGWATGMIAAFYPHAVFWTGYVLTETLYVALCSLALWGAVRAWEDNSIRWGVAAGMAAGSAALVRPPVLGLAALLCVAGMVRASRGRRVAGTAFVGIVLVVLPWAVRNELVLDSPVLTSTESGYVLWQGNSPGATGGSRGYVDRSDFTPLDLPADASETERDRTYMRAAIRWMVDNPGTVMALVPRKLWNMLRPVYADASPLNLALTMVSYPPLLLLAGVGLWRLRRTFVGVLVGTTVAYHFALHGLVTGMIRFRLPLEAVLAVPAGVAIAGVWARMRSHRVTQTGDA